VRCEPFLRVKSASEVASSGLFWPRGFLKKRIEPSRARSATEAFFYQRLETLPDTKARFRLNVALPIAFDGFGTLEVDLR
jgi:hypothetical protein